MTLSSRELLFCQKYVETGKKSQSAKDAGYKGSVATTANRLLQKDEIQATVKKLSDERDALLRITPQNVLMELAKVAFFDFGELLDLLQDETEFRPENWSTDARSAVSSIKVARTYSDGELKVTTEVRTWDRLRALKMLGDHVGAFSDLNCAIATLKTYGVHIAKVDGQWQVVQQ